MTLRDTNVKAVKCGEECSWNGGDVPRLSLCGPRKAWYYSWSNDTTKRRLHLHRTNVEGWTKRGNGKLTCSGSTEECIAFRRGASQYGSQQHMASAICHQIRDHFLVGGWRCKDICPQLGHAQTLARRSAPLDRTLAAVGP